MADTLQQKSKPWGVWGEIFIVQHMEHKRLILYEFDNYRAIHSIVGHSEPKTVNFPQPKFTATIKCRWALVANGSEACTKN